MQRLLTETTAMPKANTERLLAETRRINSDIKERNIAAGAKYGPGSRYDIPECQRSPFGEGSLEARSQQSQTMPTVDYEHGGFLLVIDKGEPYQWTCVEIEIPVPKELQGKWTGPEVLEKAINDWHAKLDKKD
jgi:hypothetical protein